MKLAQIWMAGLLRGRKRKSAEMQNSGSYRAIGVRIRVGGQGRDRTADTTIFSRVLYQLSYLTPMRMAEPPDTVRPVGRGSLVPPGTVMPGRFRRASVLPLCEASGPDGI